MDNDLFILGIIWQNDAGKEYYHTANIIMGGKVHRSKIRRGGGLEYITTAYMLLRAFNKTRGEGTMPYEQFLKKVNKSHSCIEVRRKKQLILPKGVSLNGK